MLRIYTIASSSMPADLLQAHARASSICALPIHYINTPPPDEAPSIFVGRLMDYTVTSLLNRNLPLHSIICFLDLDAFPLDILSFWSLVRFVCKTSIPVGCSAVSNHIAPFNEEFISPWFCLWRLDTLKYSFDRGITFMPSQKGDVCQDLSRFFFSQNRPPLLLSPLRYYEPFDNLSKGRLAGSRHFGYSTLYESFILHAFQSRVRSSDHFINSLQIAESQSFNIGDSDFPDICYSSSAMDRVDTLSY